MNRRPVTTADSFETGKLDTGATVADPENESVGALHRVHNADVPAGSVSTLANLPSNAPVADLDTAINAAVVPMAKIRQGSSPRLSATTVHMTRQALAEWQGMVVEVGEAYFVAELQGKLGHGVSGSLEEARIPIDEVSPDDRELLQPGAFFRLCITRELTPAGSWRRYTQVVFRRMPAYRREDLQAARAEARDLIRELRVE